MRVLVTIPHYFHTSREAGYTRPHGSNAGSDVARADALAQAISWLHRLFGPAQHWIDPKTLTAPIANGDLSCTADVVVCTTANRHVLDLLRLPKGAFEHRATSASPLLLGYECHEVLRERIGRYDYYAYLEDDLIVTRDPSRTPPCPPAVDSPR